MKASDKLKDLLNIETFASPEEARELARPGKLQHTTTVQGDMNLRETKITSPPNDLKVKGTVYGSNKKMKVPKGIKYESA